MRDEYETLQSVLELRVAGAARRFAAVVDVAPFHARIAATTEQAAMSQKTAVTPASFAMTAPIAGPEHEPSRTRTLERGVHALELLGTLTRGTARTQRQP